MNPLIQSCLEICRAGVEKRSEINLDYDNIRFIPLGNYILNNSCLDYTFHLKRIKRDNNEVTIMFSGGTDSSIAMFLEVKKRKKVNLINVDYGQPYYKNELNVYNKLYAAYNWEDDNPFTADMRYLKSLENRGEIEFNSETCLISPETEKDKDRAWKNYVFPARNLLLAAIGSQYADTVYIVANKRADSSRGVPDKTSRFFRETSDVFSDFYGRRIKVMSPFMHLSKLEAVQEYIREGGSIEALKATFSCYSPIDGPVDHCGRCKACMKRYRLFQALNVEYNFASFPPDSPYWPEFLEDEKRKRGE